MPQTIVDYEYQDTREFWRNNRAWLSRLGDPLEDFVRLAYVQLEPVTDLKELSVELGVRVVEVRGLKNQARRKRALFEGLPVTERPPVYFAFRRKPQSRYFLAFGWPDDPDNAVVHDEMSLTREEARRLNLFINEAPRWWRQGRRQTSSQQNGAG